MLTRHSNEILLCTKFHAVLHVVWPVVGHFIAEHLVHAWRMNSVCFSASVVSELYLILGKTHLYRGVPDWE